MSDSRHLDRAATLSCCCGRTKPLLKCPIRDVSLASYIKQAQRSQPIGRRAPSKRLSDKKSEKSLAEDGREQRAPSQAV
jgi:hypothetical protein